IWLNDSSIVFSTYAGLYHVTNISGDPVVKSIDFLRPGAYIGFETLFQDENNLVYIKSINDSLYILKPIDNGKDFVLSKSLHLMPDVNWYLVKEVIPLFTSERILDFTELTTTVFIWPGKPVIINFLLETYEVYLKKIISCGSLA